MAGKSNGIWLDSIHAIKSLMPFDLPAISPALMSSRNRVETGSKPHILRHNDKAGSDHHLASPTTKVNVLFPLRSGTSHAAGATIRPRLST